MLDNGLQQERRDPIPGSSFKAPEKVLPDPFSTPFSCHRFMAGPYYFLFMAGTNIEVNDSMTDGSSSSGKAVRFCSIYLRGAE